MGASTANVVDLHCAMLYRGEVANPHEMARMQWLEADQPRRFVCPACRHPTLELLGEPVAAPGAERALDPERLVPTHCGRCGQLGTFAVSALTEVGKDPGVR